MSLKINNDTANGSVTLQANNTATGDVVATLPPFSTELAPRMQLMTAKTASGTSVDFTGIPSWAKKITIMFSGVSTNGASSIQVQLGTSSSIITSGYLGSASGTSSSSGSVNNSNGFQLENSAGSAIYILHGKCELLNLSSNIWVENSVCGHVGEAATRVSGGSITLPGLLNSVRITTVTGTDTFDAGTINILVEG